MAITQSNLGVSNFNMNPFKGKCIFRARAFHSNFSVCYSNKYKLQIIVIEHSVNGLMCVNVKCK